MYHIIIGFLIAGALAYVLGSNVPLSVLLRAQPVGDGSSSEDNMMNKRGWYNYLSDLAAFQPGFDCVSAPHGALTMSLSGSAVASYSICSIRLLMSFPPLHGISSTD